MASRGLTGQHERSAAANRPTRVRFLVGLGILSAALLAALIAGGLAPTRPLVAVAAAGAVLLLGMTALWPEAIPVASMATLLVIMRVGGDGLNLSVSDAVLFVAFWAALVFAPRPYSPPMRAMLWLTAVYQASALFTVIAHPYQANTVEWFHSWLLTGGALVVGWAVGRAGRASLGLALVCGMGGFIAILTVIDGLRQLLTSGSFGPVFLAWPWGMHKNFTGCVLGFVAVIAFARPFWLPWPRWVMVTLFGLCSVGILAAQSRQALVGLGVAVVLLTLRREPGRRPNWIVLLSVVPAMVFVAAMLRDQIESGNEFNSAFQRLTWYQQALTVWQIDPAFGVGLRWWVAGRTEYGFQPPNAELEVLTSVGVVGLVGWLVLMLGGLVVLWRVDRRFGGVAVAALLSRFVQAQFDLFWVSVQVSVPFVIVGVALGAQAWLEAQRRDPVMEGVLPRATPWQTHSTLSEPTLAPLGSGAR